MNNLPLTIERRLCCMDEPQIDWEAVKDDLRARGHTGTISVPYDDRKLTCRGDVFLRPEDWPPSRGRHLKGKTLVL